MKQETVTIMEIFMALLALGAIASPVLYTILNFLHGETLKKYEVIELLFSNMVIALMVVNIILIVRSLTNMNKQLCLHNQDSRMKKVSNHMISLAKNIFSNMSGKYSGKGIYHISDGNGLIMQWKIRKMGNRDDHRLHAVFRFFSPEKETVFDILNRRIWWTISAIVDFSDGSHGVVTGYGVSEDYYSNIVMCKEPYSDIESKFGTLSEEDYRTLMLMISLVQDSDIDRLMEFQDRLEEYENQFS